MADLFSRVFRAKTKTGGYLLDGAVFLLGSVVYAVSVITFTVPNNIAPGGATGIATVFNFLFGSPIGVVIAALNLPLFFIGAKKLGISVIFRTIIATLLISLFIDVLSPFFPKYTGNVLLAALYGGVIAGFGLSLIYIRGASTGGSDLLAQILARKFRHVSIGRFILIIDFFVIVIAAFAFRSIDSALYAIITIYTSSFIVDKVIYGADAGKILFVVSKHSETIANEIMEKIKRGVTLMNVRGAYSSKENDMFVCAVRRYEVYLVKDIIYSVDPGAFIMVGDASEIVGEGFRPLEGKK